MLYATHSRKDPPVVCAQREVSFLGKGHDHGLPPLIGMLPTSVKRLMRAQRCSASGDRPAAVLEEGAAISSIPGADVALILPMRAPISLTVGGSTMASP